MHVGRAGKGKIGAVRTSGFTLTELLVVIFIIAILSAIMFPVLVKAKQTVRTSECLSNMKSIGVALNMYLNENDYRFPNAAPWGSPSHWNAQGQRTIQELLLPYVSTKWIWTKTGKTMICTKKNVFTCPNDVGFDQAYAVGVPAKQPVWRYAGCSYEYYSSNQENWLRTDMEFGVSGAVRKWTALSPVVEVASDGAAPTRKRIGAPISMVIYESRKAVLGDLGNWHLGDLTPDGKFAYRNTLFADGHAARVRGLYHFESRYWQYLRPWHSYTEVDE